MPGPSPKVTITPTDRDWLRLAARILTGREQALPGQRRMAAQTLERLAYRSELTERRHA